VATTNTIGVPTQAAAPISAAVLAAGTPSYVVSAKTSMFDIAYPQF
jgi:hypothetical protein